MTSLTELDRGRPPVYMQSDAMILQVSLPLCCTIWTLIFVCITFFLFFVLQCTWFVLVKLELTNAWRFTVLPLPKIKLKVNLTTK